MSFMKSREDREAELRALASTTHVLLAILMRYKAVRGGGPIPTDENEMIRQILDYEYGTLDRN
jgi:hypothetical protein